MKKQLVLIIAVCSILAATFTGCKKDKDTNPVSKPTIAFTKSDYKPLELAILQADKEFSADNLTAKVDGETVTLTVMDSNRIGVLMPIKAAGNYTLNIETDRFSSNAIAFTIAAYTTIDDPQPKIDEFKGKMTDRLTQLTTLKNQNNWNISAQNITELQQMQDAFSVAMASASTEEKKAVAYFIQNNAFLSTPLENIAFADSFYAKAEVDAGDELFRIGKQLAASSVIIVAEITVFNGLFNLPEPTGVSKLLAFTTAIALGGQFCYTFSLIDRLGDIIGKAVDFNFNGVVNFTSSSVVKMMDNLSYRTLTAADISENGYIRTLVAQVNKFDGYWTTFKAGVNKVKSWFGGVPSVTDAVQHLKETPVFKNFYAKQNFLSIGNVSNSNIQLQVVDVNGDKTIKAAATGITQTTTFNFDVTYTHPDLGNTIKKTISAKFVPDSLSLLDKLIQWGPWKMTIYSDGVADGINVWTFSTTTLSAKAYDLNGNLGEQMSYVINLTGNTINIQNQDPIGDVVLISPTQLKIDAGSEGMYEFTPYP